MPPNFHKINLLTYFKEAKLEQASQRRRTLHLMTRHQILTAQDRKPIERGTPVHFDPPAKKVFRHGAA